MSIQLMSRCFDADLPVEGAEQVLLLKLCDLANDDGTCWPGIALLARSSRRKERQVRNLLRALEAKRLITTAVGTGPGHTNRYRITLPPKPAEGSTTNANRQPVAGGTALPVGQPIAPTPAIQRRTPGNPATATPAIASAPNPSGTIKNPHTPTGGVGVGGACRSDLEGRRHLERVLDRLGCANGRKALPRWWIMSAQNPLAQTFQQRVDLVVWCVNEARARGRLVNYASDIVELVDQWLPEGSIDDEEPGQPVAAAS